jgi:hypothetical protein
MISLIVGYGATVLSVFLVLFGADGIDLGGQQSRVLGF